MPGQEVIVDAGMARIVVVSRRHGRREILLDRDDLAIASRYHWCISTSGRTLYAVANVVVDSRRTMVKLHKLLTGWPETDHRNRDGLDNRRSNLRPASRSLNNANKPLQRNSTTGYKGVSYNKRSGKWFAQVKHKGQNNHLGHFADPAIAAEAYDRVARELFGEYALTNFQKGTAS